jgi:hypothetical protein
MPERLKFLSRNAPSNARVLTGDAAHRRFLLTGCAGTKSQAWWKMHPEHFHCTQGQGHFRTAGVVTHKAVHSFAVIPSKIIQIAGHSTEDCLDSEIYHGEK